MQSIPRSKKLLQILLFAFLLFFVGWGLYTGAENLGYNWQWFRVPRYLLTYSKEGVLAGPLLQGLAVTLKITVCALLLALVFGLVTAMLRLSDRLVGNLVANIYLETIRNTPLLVQIFVVYFVLAPLLGVDRFWAAVLALALFEGAYVSEIIRAGIVAIPKGQWEASRTIGLTTLQSYRHVILPQAVRQMAPPLTSQAVSLIKDSALVSTISIFDLTMRGQQIVAETFLTFEVWITVAGIYLLLTLSLSGLVKILETRSRNYQT